MDVESVLHLRFSGPFCLMVESVSVDAQHPRLFILCRSCLAATHPAHLPRLESHSGARLSRLSLRSDHWTAPSPFSPCLLTSCLPCSLLSWLLSLLFSFLFSFLCPSCLFSSFPSFFRPSFLPFFLLSFLVSFLPSFFLRFLPSRFPPTGISSPCLPSEAACFNL